MKKLIYIITATLISVNAFSQVNNCCPDFSLRQMGNIMPCEGDSTCKESHNGAGNPGGGSAIETITACKNSVQSYYVFPNLPGFTFNWTIVGGTPTSFTGNPAVITWGNGTQGFLQVIISDASGNCRDTITKKVCLLNSPIAAFTVAPGTTVCVNQPVIFTNASLGASSYTWNFGDGTGSTLFNPPPHLYTTPGTYTVTLIVTTAQGCKDTVDNPVTIHTPPVANFSGPIEGCAPICNNYTDLSTCIDGTIASWQWSFPGGYPAFASSENPQNICYNSAGTFGASLIITSNYGCKDSIDITPLVTVHPWPQAEFDVVPAIAPATSPTFNFNDLWSTEVTNWVWNFGDSSPLDSTNTDPVHSYSASATANDFYAFQVCLRVETQYGCWDTVCHIVELVPEFTFYIPNTVTPNGDGTNEFFFGKSRGVKEYNIWLFDRWGNLVWDCGYKGKNTDWDAPMQDGMSSFCKWDAKVEPGGVDMSGNSKLLAQEDVYVWKVKLTDIFDKKHTYIGHVSVVR